MLAPPSMPDVLFASVLTWLLKLAVRLPVAGVLHAHKVCVCEYSWRQALGFKPLLIEVAVLGLQYLATLGTRSMHFGQAVLNTTHDKTESDTADKGMCTYENILLWTSIPINNVVS